MDLSAPVSSVIPGVPGLTLGVLARALRPMSAREVARLLEGRASQRGVLDALNRLVTHGIVLREDHPPLALFRLNREHVAATAVAELVGLREVLFTRLRDLIGGWRVPVVSALVFGSAARGDGGVQSDVDLLIIRRTGADLDEPAWRAQIHDLSEQVERWSGNPADIVEYDETELRRLAGEDNPLITAVLHDGRPLVGPSLLRLLSGAKH